MQNRHITIRNVVDMSCIESHGNSFCLECKTFDGDPYYVDVEFQRGSMWVTWCEDHFTVTFEREWEDE